MAPVLAGASRLGLRQGPLQRGRWAGPPRPSAPHGPPPRQGRRRSRLLQVRLRAARGLRRPPRLPPGRPAQHAYCPRPTLTSAVRGGAGRRRGRPTHARFPPSRVLDWWESEGEGRGPRFCGKTPPRPEAPGAGQRHVRSPEPGCSPGIACRQLPPERRGRGQEARSKVTRPEQVGLVGRCEGGAAGGL